MLVISIHLLAVDIVANSGMMLRISPPEHSLTTSRRKPSDTPPGYVDETHPLMCPPPACADSRWGKDLKRGWASGLLGVGHVGRHHPLGELFLVKEAQRQRRLLQRQPFLVRLLGDLRGLVASRCAGSARSPASASGRPARRCARGWARCPGRSAGRSWPCRRSTGAPTAKLWMTRGLKTLSSKLPLAPPMLMATSLPSTCAASMVTASHCVGLTLPGMMELPGSFSEC